MSGRGALRRKGARCAPMFLPPPPVLPLRPANTSHQPFCEHVLQHSCCSTFLWQRLFFLTSTQKLPSAQDSSFAFHRPGRSSAGVGGGGLKKRGTHTNKHKQTHAETRTGPEPRDRSGQVSDDRKRVFFFFLIQSQVMFIEVEMIAVQWSDWFHVRRDRR